MPDIMSVLLWNYAWIMYRFYKGEELLQPVKAQRYGSATDNINKAAWSMTSAGGMHNDCDQWPIANPVSKLRMRDLFNVPSFQKCSDVDGVIVGEPRYLHTPTPELHSSIILNWTKGPAVVQYKLQPFESFFTFIDISASRMQLFQQHQNKPKMPSGGDSSLREGRPEFSTAAWSVRACCSYVVSIPLNHQALRVRIGLRPTKQWTIWQSCLLRCLVAT